MVLIRRTLRRRALVLACGAWILVLAGCATAYSVRVTPAGDPTEGALLPPDGRTATTRPGPGGEIQLSIPVPDPEAAQGVIGCVFVRGDDRAPAISQVTTTRTPRGETVLTFSMPRDHVSSLRDFRLWLGPSQPTPMPRLHRREIAIDSAPGRRRQGEVEYPCPNPDDRLTTAYAFEVEEARQGELLAVGIAAIALVVALASGSW